MRRLAWMMLAVAGSCSGGGTDPCSTWTQWGQNADHNGAVCAPAQSMARVLARVVYDPFNADEIADPGGRVGALLVHYQAPLVVGDDVYMMAKSGTYTPCVIIPPDTVATCDPFRKNSQIWVEKGYRWEGGALVQKWSFESDWKPEPGVSFEPFFQPVVAGDFIYIPGAGGTVYQLDRTSGQQIRQIKPLGDTIDPDTYVAGPITAGADGAIYYNVLKLDHDNPYGTDAESWIVKVPEGGAPQSATYTSIVTGAPAPDGECRRVFTVAFARPWPPEDVDGNPVYPPTGPCGSQRPGINVAPAVGADGTIFTASKAHFNDRYSYIVALNPDLTTKWASSLRDNLNDGCGVLIPADDQPFNCRATAREGVDPNTNEKPAGRVNDQSSASPVALPDGGVLYGTFTGYNGSRGHLMKLDAAGRFKASWDFGWDITPAIYRHGATYSVILKENNYWEDENGTQLGPFYITQLDADLHMEWRYQHTDTQSCTKDDNGQVTCVDDHPNGFEWCINAPVVDADGTVFALNENGRMYAIRQGGTVKESFFLERALGAAYTPVTMDGQGRVYGLNFGVMSVLGQ